MAKFDISDSPGHLLRRAQQYSFDLFSAETGSSKLTPRQFTVLLTVQQNEGLSQTDLVKRTGIDRSTLADMISRLISRKLLSRTRTKEDARANSVKITAAGKKQVASHTAMVRRAENKILGPIAAGQRAGFMKNLKSIAAAADALDAGQGKPAAPKKKAAKKAAKKKVAKKKAPKKAAKKKTAKKKR
jgi:DNA-binding MarR family transcriptional regulator